MRRGQTMDTTLEVIRGIESVTYIARDGHALSAVIGRIYHRTQALPTQEYVISIHVVVGKYAQVFTDSGAHYIPWYNVIEWFKREGMEGEAEVLPLGRKKTV
jgi:hypothetical protein